MKTKTNVNDISLFDLWRSITLIDVTLGVGIALIFINIEYNIKDLRYDLWGLEKILSHELIQGLGIASILLII